MMKSFCVIAVAGAFALAGAAFASDPPAPPSSPPPPPASPDAPQPPPEPPKAAEKDPLDEIVCRKEEPTVGTRLNSRKICKTRRQWRDEQRDATSTDLPDGSWVPPPSPGGAS